MVSLHYSQIDDRIEAFRDKYLELLRLHDERILSRHNMTMRDAAPFAADMAIIELAGDDQWLIRLSGTNHCRRANRDRTGENVLAGRSAAERIRRKQVVEHLFAKPCAVKAVWKERFDGEMSATTASITFPALGRKGEKMLIAYELLVDEIEWVGPDHTSQLNAVDLIESRFVDIGSGVPD